MSIPLTINGAVFNYPQNFDEGWGVDATGWAQAVTNGALYLSGGNFPLTAAVDFGTSFGVKVKSITSETANPSTSGYLLLARSDTISWRNNANSANLGLTVNSSDQLTFNGSALGLTSLTSAHIFVGNASNVPTDVAMSGDATMANTGALTIAGGAVTNAKVSASAAIDLTKLAPTTASRALRSDISGLIAVSTTTETELGYLSGVTSAVQTQLDARLPLSGGTMSGAVSMASHKITSLAFGTTSGDAAAFGQLISNNIVGTTTNDNATAGYIGQTTSSTYNSVSITNGQWGDGTSISLSAGDWSVTHVCVGAAGATTNGQWQAGISTTAGNSSAGLTQGDNQLFGVFSANLDQSLSVASYRMSLASATTVYAKINDGSAGTAPVFFGRISAIRIR